jgi:hypothetical protein
VNAVIIFTYVGLVSLILTTHFSVLILLSPRKHAQLGEDLFQENLILDPYICCLLVKEKFRVARWYIFIPKIPIWVYFGEPWNGKW